MSSSTHGFTQQLSGSLGTVASIKNKDVAKAMGNGIWFAKAAALGFEDDII